MPIVSKLSQYSELSQVALDVNTPSVAKIDTLFFQPSGELVFTSENGIGYHSDDLMQKAIGFLDLARNVCASLILTPEGSIDIEIIQNIIGDEQKWPAIGKLWCLCSTGVPVTKYRDICQKLNNMESVFIVESQLCFQLLHVNSIWYLFRINEHKLGIVVQHKTIHMRDIHHTGEASGLSFGDTIFIFDLSHNMPNTQLFSSLICADAIGTSISTLLTSSFGHNLLLFNPQLNPNPYADDFKTFRTTLFRPSDIKACRLITLNWAAGTSINDKQIEITDFPGSSLTIPIPNNPREAFRTESFFTLRKKNRTKGLYLYYNDTSHNWVWRIFPQEIILYILINNPDAFMHNQHLSGKNEPECKNIYIFDKSNDIQTAKHVEIINCDSSFQNMISGDSNYEIPFPCVFNKDDVCVSQGCNLVYCDYFFGLCFGDIKFDGLDLDNERSKSITSVLDKDGKNKRVRQAALFNRLVRNLVNNLLPESLEYLKNNNRFEINENAVVTGSDQIFNLTPITGPTHKKAIVIIYDVYDDSEVAVLYKMIQNMTNIEFKNQIIIYYRDQNNEQFIPYEYPHQQYSIKTSSMTRNPTSIR